jgi:SulP family sulfate permease
MLAILAETVRKAGEINPFVVITAVLGIGVMVLVRRINRKLPAALIAIAAAGVLVQLAGWQTQGVRLVSDLGLPANPGLSLHLPQVGLSDWLDLLPAAGAVALFSLVEAMSIAKALGQASGQRPDASREFIGQGMASIACGLLQAIPSSGSPSRSAVNFNAGAKTRLAAAFSGGFVWLSLVIFIGLIGYIPVPGLAAVVVVSALGLVDRKHTLLTWRTRSFSRLVMASTFAATLLLPLHIAIYLGVVLSILIHLYESGRLNLAYLVFEEDGRVREKALAELYAAKPAVAVLNVEGDLFFGAVTDLERAVDGCLDAGVRVLVLRLRRIHSLASTGVTTLQWAIVAARRRGTTVLLSGVSPEARAMLDSVGISMLVGDANIFEGGEVVFESTRRALEAARGILLGK